MDRRSIIKATLGSLLSAIPFVRRAAAGFGIFQVGGAGTFVPTLQQIDGGSTFFATGYLNGASATVPFSKATAFPTSITFPAPIGTINYVNGWDDPRFFPMGNWLGYINLARDVTAYLNVYWTVQWTCISTSNTTIIRNAGISLMANSGELFSSGGGGLIPNNNGGSNSFAAETEIVGFLAVDEPTASTQFTNPIAGSPANGCGTAGSPCIINSIQDGRIWWVNWAGTIWLGNPTNVLSNTPSHWYSTFYPTPTGASRHLDFMGFDYYAIPVSFRPDVIYTGTGGALVYTQVSQNYVPGTGTVFTQAQARKATHNGNWTDYQRPYFTYPSPIVSGIGTCNCKGNQPYMPSGAELNWEIWAVIIHGSRAIYFFDTDDGQSRWALPWTNINGPTGFEGYTFGTRAAANQSCTFTGTIASGVLTVTSQPSGGFIQTGMQLTSVAGGAVGNPMILGQLTMTNEATFTGAFTGPGTLVASAVTGSIFLGAAVGYSGGVGANVLQSDPLIIAGPAPGAGTYTLNRDVTFGGAVTPTSTWYSFTPGTIGTYAISDQSLSGTSVSITATAADTIVFGPAKTTNAATGTINDQMHQTCQMVIALARVINSPFAVSYILPTTTPLAYNFPSDDGVNPTVKKIPPQTVAYGQSTGVHCCAKYYTGGTFSVGTDSITNGIYIFATTSNAETDGPMTVTFHIADTSKTTATAIGEGGRTIAISGGVFTDTFAFAWTVHVYKIT